MSTYANITLDPYDTIGPIGTIDLSGSYTYGTGSTYTIPSSSIFTSTGTGSSWLKPDTAVQLGTDGIIMKEGTDLKLGNVSLKDFIDRIEQRLALLTPNPELEKEWAELKELGDRYRALEKDIKEKMETWEILKRDDST